MFDFCFEADSCSCVRKYGGAKQGHLQVWNIQRLHLNDVALRCCVRCCPAFIQVRLPVRCVALLRLLLDCLLGASSHKGLRAELYVLLLQYLTFCRWVGSCSIDCS